MIVRSFAGLASCVFVLSIAVPSVHAFDVTGTWVGKWSCKGFDGEKFTDGNPTSTMLITQTGDTMAIDLDGGSYRYNGRAITDVAKPDKGEAVLASCAIDNQPGVNGLGELVRLAVKTKSGVVKASLKGLSIYENTPDVVGTCKYSFKRTSETNPNVLGCPG